MYETDPFAPPSQQSLLDSCLEALSKSLSPEADVSPDALLSWQEWLSRRLPGVASAAFGEHHLRAWDWFDSLQAGVKPLALIEDWARGQGKSTTVELGISRVSVKRTRRFGLYVCAKQEASNNHVGAIATTMEKLGIERLLNKYGFSKGWTASKLRTSSGFSVLGVGLDMAVRGLKFDNDRPDIIIFDDIDDLEDSADAVDKKIRIITQNILPAGAPHCGTAFFQNGIHANSVMSRLKSGELDMLRRRVQSPTVVAVQGLAYAEVEDDETGRRIWKITAGTATWPGKPIEVCEAEINEFGLGAFLRECQNQLDAGGKFFKEFTPERDGWEWHVCAPFAVPKHWPVWASHDYGEGAPCCSLVFTADEFGDIYVIGEHYKAGLVSSEQAQALLDLLETLGIAAPVDPNNRAGLWTNRLKTFPFDHANTFPPEKEEERRGEYPVEVWWRRGLRAIKAVKDRKAGWRHWREWLAAKRWIDDSNADSPFYGKRRLKPRFQIFAGAAPNLQTFLAKAVCHPRDPEELDPGFKADHAGDSGRYGLMVRARPSGPAPPKEAMIEVFDDDPNSPTFGAFIERAPAKTLPPQLVSHTKPERLL